MKEVSPDFNSALDMYNTKQLLAKNINSNFFNAVQNDKTVVPAAVELIQKGGNGSDAIRQLFNNGFREQLVRNSNQPPIVQLTSALGSDPLKQQNTIAFLRSTGMEDVADKYTGLVGMVNTITAAGKTNSGNAKFLNTAMEGLDNKTVQEGMSKLLESSSKWSEEFKTILGKKGDALTRSEQIVNLIKRAGKTAGSVTSAKSAINTTSAENQGALAGNMNNQDSNEDQY
jgi:hypothetical protein